MRAFVLRSLAFALASLAAVLAGRALAQAAPAPSATATTAAEQPEEVTVRGQRSLAEFRLELQRARDDIFKKFNAANEGTDTDVRCKNERPTGTRMSQSVCRSEAENNRDASAANAFLDALFQGSGKFIQNTRAGAPNAVPGGTNAMANAGSARAQADGEIGAANALAAFEKEWERLLSEDRDLYTAVVKYVELEDEYARARGDTVADVPDLMRGAPAVEPTGPQCEASTLTEYSQRNDTAVVSGTVSISNCPAGTAGGFTLVARVRNDAGDVTPLEFKQTWQRADAEDHKFQAEYPIGENVFLQSVRARDLTCTCAPPAR